MNRIRSIGMSLLTVSVFASGCATDKDLDGAATAAAAAVRAVWNGNAAELNGSKINGSKINGSKINGSKINGTTTNSLTVGNEGGTLVGFVLETGAVLRGPNFYPAKLTAVLEDSSEAEVRVVDWKQISLPGLPAMDYYMVKDLATDQSICGNDELGNPIWALPLTRTFNQYNGKAVSSVNQFSFNCYGGALEKCNRYGYPDWITRAETYTGHATPSKNRSLDAYHDACVAMVRADYCGDGQAHTYNGTTIDLYDNLGFNNPDTVGDGTGGWHMEAEWGADGAWCIHHTRWMPNSLTKDVANNNSSANPDWQYIQTFCPERIAGNPWPANPLGGSAPRKCGAESDWFKDQGGYDKPNQWERPLIRNHTPLYQH
jgi:hypothetical protein